MGEELSDIKKAMHLLHSLPPSYQTLSKILLHRDNKAVTYNEVSQPSGQDNLQRTGFKRQRSRSPERRRVQFQVPSPNKRNLKNLVCWRCGKNGNIKKDCRMQIGDVNLPQVANVAEHLHSEEEDVFTDGL
ncbi:hypothetical protein AXG93_3818s1100 [Marchantia polymorpha subsp. ruderalis]|uniref:CCHC-type domain-containing protein n=1 Tax=Marchantia polymorpha subsp. ruderalis TaxID=1480154 RepID=A0A176VIC7_MARPO|nr:hypothetical protein AXG93_3818s1100 [Marchantia polymorpha subsp. ruderalis]